VNISLGVIRLVVVGVFMTVSCEPLPVAGYRSPLDVGLPQCYPNGGDWPDPPDDCSDVTQLCNNLVNEKERELCISFTSK
jgi:hypothetical protein